MLDDQAESSCQYEAKRLGGVAVELKSHLPIVQQARVIGTTWLNQQLIGATRGLADRGFGGDAKQTVQQRADFLEEQELAQAAKDIAAATGLEHRSVADGQRVAGIYRHNVILASGRYAMLDDCMSFSLVPRKR